MRRRLGLTTILAGAAWSFGAPCASAQSQEPEDGAVDTIVVTAQRRAQDLQDVPAAVTAISDQALAEQEVRDVGDLQYQVPNISIATATGTANAARIFLRGVGEDESRGAVDPAVGVYVDGIFIGRLLGSLFDVVDLERIEVLRGPQGTLYGRNSNGGAIKLVSKKPGGENEARFGGTIGNYDYYEGRGMVNLALGERAGLRVSGLYRERDGYWDLNPNGDFEGQGGTVGDQEVASVRGAFSVDFGTDWNALLVGDYTRDDSDPVPDSAAPPNDVDDDVFTIEPLAGVTCSQFAPVTFQPLGCFTDYRSKIETGGVSLNVGGPIGQFDLMSLTGYRETTDDLATRIGFPYFQQTDQDQFSQELTLTSNLGGAFEFVTGLYYFTEDVQLDTTFIFPSTVIVDTSSVAGFVQGTYDFDEATRLTAGLRYTDEKREFAGRNIALSGAVPDLFGSEESISEDNVTYTISVDHDLSGDVMVYTSYATGFKSAGFSPDCFSPNDLSGGPDACFRPVRQEELGSAEVGVRSLLMEGRLRFNATAFWNDYEDLQIGATVPDLGFTRFNVPGSEIRGLEFEANLEATDALSFFGNLGVLDTKYTEVDEVAIGGLTNSGAACPNGVPTRSCALGLDLKNAPAYKGQVGVRYEAVGVAGGDLVFTGDANFEDESWSLVANGPPHALTDPGILLNARVAWTAPSDRYTVAVFGRNLTDDEYWRAASANSFTAYAAPPLTYGIDLDVRF